MEAVFNLRHSRRGPARAAPASGLVTDCHVEIGSGPTEAPARDQVAFQTRMYLN